MNWLKYFILVIVGILLTSCAAAVRMIDYGDKKTDVAMSESIFLSPTEAEKTIYIQIRNTTSNQGLTQSLEYVVLPEIQKKGYRLVLKPSQATYILQANIRYVGEWKEGMNFGDTLTGAGMGALAGLGIGRSGGAALAGGVIGGAAGFAADLLTRVKVGIAVIEFQITEMLSKEQDITGQRTEKQEITADSKSLGALGTMKDAPTRKVRSQSVSSTKEGTKIYNAAVAAKAAQVNLNIDESIPILIQKAGLQIAGIF